MISPPRNAATDGANLLVSGWEDQWGGNLVQVWDPVAGKIFPRPDAGRQQFGQLVVERYGGLAVQHRIVSCSLLVAVPEPHFGIQRDNKNDW